MPDTSRRDVLAIPDRPYAGLVTYDAKDPATSFPPIEPLRPPSGAPNVLVEGGAVVSEDYGPRGNEFTGAVHWVQIDLADAAEDLDHLITPEERLRVAMAKQ